VCFAKHTLNKHNLGRLGLKPRSGPLSFFFWLGLAQPTWAGLDLTGPVWLMVQTSNRPRKQAHVNQLTCALHSTKVINYLRTVLKSSNLKQSKRRKPYLAKTNTKVMVLAPGGECSPLPPPFSHSALVCFVCIMGSLHRFWVFSFSRFFSLFFSHCFLASVCFLFSFSAVFPPCLTLSTAGYL